MKDLKIIIDGEVHVAKKFDYDVPCEGCSLRINCDRFNSKTCPLLLGAEEYKDEILTYSFVRES
nr:MAG TPA: Kti11, Kti13 transfer, tRNA modification, Complex [Caudoviricetes sp.]